MTDGYGDYVRHYLRAMAAAPQLAPDSEDHLLRTWSIVKRIVYNDEAIEYDVFDNASTEILRLTSKPSAVTANGVELDEVADDAAEGWTWRSLSRGGVMTINQSAGNQIKIVR